MRTLFIGFTVFFLSTALMANTTQRLHEEFRMETPSQKWSDALPIGNGRLGALIYGDTTHETLVINESSIWAPPTPQWFPENGKETLDTIRTLLFKGQQAQAEKLCASKLLKGPSRISAFQPLGFLTLTFPESQAPVKNYQRGIYLDEGITFVSYEQAGVTFHREAFADSTHDALIFTFETSRHGALNFTLSANRGEAPLTCTPLSSHQLLLSGSTGEGGVDFQCIVDIQTSTGRVTTHAEQLVVSNATQVTLTLTAATNYNLKNPQQPLTGDWSALLKEPIQKLRNTPYNVLRKAHASQFKAQMQRTFINLATDTVPPRTIESYLEEARTTHTFSKPFLLLYTDYCKYLLISASRPGGLPANLQGLWNPLMTPPWRSDYHTDINLSMFYWPAATWDLGELAEPILTLAEIAYPANAPIAKAMFGIDQGSFITTSTDAWGMTAPFRLPCWGMYVSGGAWVLQDALKPWYTTHDPNILKRLYPLLRSQTQFYLQWLVRHPTTGLWVSGPSASPENTYQADDGGKSAIDMGPAHDQELIYATFTSFIDIAKRVHPDDALLPTVQNYLKDLALPQIAPDGSLQEWSRPFKEVEPGHRHLSHTYGLVPGRRLSRTRTPAITAAIQKTIQKRQAAGYNLMGWSVGVLANLQVRLGEGNAALETLTQAPQFLCGNLFTSASNANGMCPQVSDMNGVSAALNEMLLQSDNNAIFLLPALPTALANKGSFRLCAEGGFLIEADWENGLVTHLKVTAHLGGTCRLHYNTKVQTLTMTPGEAITLF